MSATDIVALVSAVLAAITAIWYNNRQTASDQAALDSVAKGRTDAENKLRAAEAARADAVVATGDRKGAEALMAGALSDGVPEPGPSVNGVPDGAVAGPNLPKG